MLGQLGRGESYRNMLETTKQRQNLLKVPVIGAFTLDLCLNCLLSQCKLSLDLDLKLKATFHEYLMIYSVLE